MIFFPYFYSIVVANTSKLLFFHNFSIVLCVLYATIVPYPSLFTSYYLSFPHFSIVFHQILTILFKFSIVFPFFFHYFTLYFFIFFIVLSLFPLHCNFPIPARRADQMGINTPPSPNCHLVHNPWGFFSGGCPTCHFII